MITYFNNNLSFIHVILYDMYIYVLERISNLQKINQIKKSTIWNINKFNFFLYESIWILLSFFPVYFQSIGLNAVLIGFIMAGGPFISIFANPFWAYWSDRLQNINRILVIMLVGNVIVVQFVFQLHSITLMVISMFIFFFFQILLFSQSNSLLFNTIEGNNYKLVAFRLSSPLDWSVMLMF